LTVTEWVAKADAIVDEAQAKIRRRTWTERERLAYSERVIRLTGGKDWRA
jgi:hypothetical protein